MSLSHHSLVAWQRADDLFIKLNRLSSNAFPASERYELSGQLRRAADSVAANIVEGFARRLGYISEALEGELEMDVKAVGAPLAGLIRHTRSALTSQVGIVLLIECITSPRVTHQTYLTHQTHRLARSRRHRIAADGPADAPSVRAADSARSNNTLG
jgi:23S rRNA-intervening sequence protein